MNVATLVATTSREETLDIHNTARKSRKGMGRHNSGSAHDDDKGGNFPGETVREGKQRIKGWMKLGNYSISSKNSSEKSLKSTCKT